MARQCDIPKGTRLKAVGGDIKFTLLPDRDHSILDIYEDKQLDEWFLRHKRKASRHEMPSANISLDAFDVVADRAPGPTRTADSQEIT